MKIARQFGNLEFINDMNSHIASTADEQSMVSKEMRKNIISISRISDQTAQGASENLAASQEITKLAKKFTASYWSFSV